MATSATSKIENPKVTSQAQWLAARKQLLTKEKEFTRLRDEISRQRRELPWERTDLGFATHVLTNSLVEVIGDGRRP